jgi:two-component system sensor histidine kinase RegB
MASQQEAPRSSQLRLGTLNMLRLMAGFGQLGAILFVHYNLGFELPLVMCLLSIGASILLTGVIWLNWPGQKRPSDRAIFALLMFDQTQLASVLFLTGGVQNPFAIVFLAAPVVGALSLYLRYTALLCGWTLCLLVVLAFWHFPLPWEAGKTLALPPLFVGATWVALATTIIFITIALARISMEAWRLQAGYAAMERALASEQKLSALGSLAAAAAHELGTPLGTIAVVAKELQRELPKEGPLAEDAALLRAQVERCRVILRRLAEHRESDGIGPDSRLPLLAFLDDLAEPYRSAKIRILIDGAEDQPAIKVMPELRYAIGNLIANAAGYAASTVTVTAKWDDARIVVRVRDNGPGFAPDVLHRLGEPYVTTRPGRTMPTNTDTLIPLQPGRNHAGMGLGFFIAKTLLERTGAILTFGNAFEGGASVTMDWPRERLEAAGDHPKGAMHV